MLVEAVEASKHARKRGRVMGIVAAHRLKQMRTLLMYEELATWRRANDVEIRKQQYSKFSFCYCSAVVISCSTSEEN